MIEIIVTRLKDNIINLLLPPHLLTGKHSGIVRGFLIGVGIMAVALSVAVLASPIFGAVLAGIMIGIGLLITGIQMIFVGIQGRRGTQIPASDITR